MTPEQGAWDFCYFMVFCLLTVIQINYLLWAHCNAVWSVYLERIYPWNDGKSELCVFQKQFFCRKSEKYYVNCPWNKNTWQEFVFLRLRKRTEKRTKKEPKNSDEYIAKNVRNVGKIRFYEKISIEWWNTFKYQPAGPLHRRGSELCHERSVPCGHSVCHVLSGCFREIRWCIVIYAQNNANDVRIQLCIVQRKTDNPTQINAVVIPV